MKLFSQKNDASHQVHVKVPGKLFISGEYAILSPQQPAIILAVNQYLSLSLEESPSKGTGILKSDDLNFEPLHYQRTRGKLTYPNPLKEQWKYVLSAITIVERLLTELHIPLKDYQMTFQSQLVNHNGVKIGLGSSGAVVVATVRALLDFYHLKVTDTRIIFQLAAISLLNIHSQSSFGDIAAISYGGWNYYQAVDRQWLKQELEATSTIHSLLQTQWKDLIIERLQPPHDLQIIFGWTQSPASTDNLVAKLYQGLNNNQTTYHQFLEDSKTSVQAMYQAFIDQNTSQILAEVDRYRQLLQNLSQAYQLEIETKTLQRLISLANQYHFHAKTSGAGGGDCGIALGTQDLPATELKADWQQHGIMPLNFSPSELYTGGTDDFYQSTT